MLLEHPSIKECAVVGIPDPTYGEVGAHEGRHGVALAAHNAELGGSWQRPLALG